MAAFNYKPTGVCARQISFEIVDGKLYGVSFLGGCNGNLKAIGTLLEGQSAAEAVRLLRGNDCNGRGTSCADQLAQAVEKALSEGA